MPTFLSVDTNTVWCENIGMEILLQLWFHCLIKNYRYAFVRILPYFYCITFLLDHWWHMFLYLFRKEKHAMQSIGKRFLQCMGVYCKWSIFLWIITAARSFERLCMAFFQQRGICFWLPLGLLAKQSHCCVYLKKWFETAFKPSRETSQHCEATLIIQREKLCLDSHARQNTFSMLSITLVKNYPQGVSGLGFVQLFSTPTLILFYVCHLLACANVVSVYL